MKSVLSLKKTLKKRILVEKRNNLNVLMVIGLFHPFVGGAERECQKLSKKLLEQGISVTVLTQCREGLPGYEVIDGIPVYRRMKLTTSRLFEVIYMFSVLWFLLRNIRQIDIIQCFGLYLFIPPVVLMKYLFGKKVIARVEGPGYVGDFHRVKQLKWANLMLFTAKKVDRIIAISKDLYKDIAENHFPEQTILSIPNSVDVDYFLPKKNCDNTRLHHITFVGRLEAVKGLEYLIQALKIVKMELDYVKLSLIGGGQLHDELKTLCQKFELLDDVTITGNTDNVLSYYQKTDLFVLPSLSEGLSLSLLEAMSCGLPVVATLVGGNAEIIDSHFKEGNSRVNDYYIGEGGILVKPKDVMGLSKAILKILQDAGLSKQLGDNARSLVEKKFSLEKVAKEYIGLYHSLV